MLELRAATFDEVISSSLSLGIRSFSSLASSSMTTYAKLVVNLVQKGSGGPLSNDVIIADCIEGLQKILRTRIQHCYKEANKCADALARRGTLLPQDLVIFHSPPANVALLINLDATGNVYVRRRSSIVFYAGDRGIRQGAPNRRNPLPSPLRIIEVIYAAPKGLTATSEKEVMAVELVDGSSDMQPSGKKIKLAREPIAFDDNDLEATVQPHDDALIVTT
nr:hypothetical protein CFP56_61265 [Quercus suber]